MPWLWPDSLWHLLRSNFNLLSFAAFFPALVVLIITSHNRRPEPLKKRPITLAGMVTLLLGTVVKDGFHTDLGDGLRLLGWVIVLLGLLLEKKPRQQPPPRPDAGQSGGETVWPPSIKPPV